jgi:hypothetical protein
LGGTDTGAQLAIARGLGVGAKYMHTAVRIQLAQRARPVIQIVPVRITQLRKQSRKLLLAYASPGLHPGSEGVVSHRAPQVEDRLVFHGASRLTSG